MLNNWINKIKENFKTENMSKFKDMAVEFLKTKKIQQNSHCHVINLSILVGSYVLGSLLIYPKFGFSVFFKELFAIVCIYSAILCWFTEKFSENNILRICLAVTTCFAPVIFMNNSFAVAVVCLLLVVLIEYITFSYLQGHRLFSKNTPVYVICEDSSDLDAVRRLLNEYKVLELVVLSESKFLDMEISNIHSIESLAQQLRKVRRIPFFPQPRKFIYCAKK